MYIKLETIWGPGTSWKKSYFLLHNYKQSIVIVKTFKQHILNIWDEMLSSLSWAHFLILGLLFSFWNWCIEFQDCFIMIFSSSYWSPWIRNCMHIVEIAGSSFYTISQIFENLPSSNFISKVVIFFDLWFLFWQMWCWNVC